jgi:Tol biopolymer transport system component
MLRLLVALLLLLPQSAPDALVFDHPINEWFEGPLNNFELSSDATEALLTRGFGHTHLFSLPSGRKDPETLRGNLDRIDVAGFCGPGNFIRHGSRGSETGIFIGGATPYLSTLPHDALPVCSPDGSAIAYFHVSDPARGVFVGVHGEYQQYSVTGEITAMTFSPDNHTFYYLVFHPDGESSLNSINLRSGKVLIIAEHLDASPILSRIALPPNGNEIFLPLISDAPPDNKARHNPAADRWLKIYALDVSTGRRRVVVDSPGQDLTSPQVINNNLYWTRTVVHDSIVTLPIAGGGATEILSGAELPMWSPDRKRISYTFGGWRLVDWALNLDDGVVSVDENARRISEPSVIVSGYHEDFPPSWSPDGKWIAYHSHRSQKPVPEYSSTGSSDDIYLRLADNPRAPEIRLTDYGWETGSPYWSPDGKKLLFHSWQRGGMPGIYKLFVLTLNSDTGEVLKSEILPLDKTIRSVAWAAWSPDGKEIAIVDDRGAGKRTLLVVHSDGSHSEKILDYSSPTLGGVDWTHDGKSIIYAASEAPPSSNNSLQPDPQNPSHRPAGNASFSGPPVIYSENRLQLFSIPRAGGQPTQLTHDSANLMHPRVSPDGRFIAATRISQSKQILRRPL